MRALRLLSISILLCMQSLCAFAEDTPIQQKALAIIAPQFPHLKSVWAIAEGDLNGDGIHDLALLLTGQKGENDPREERLFVLTGNPDGSYRLLSVSAEFCHPSKFYNLDIKKNSLFVEAVEAVDATGISSYTLQFRYNAKLHDVELIGREENSHSYKREENSDGDKEDYEDRTSSNYLTGKIIHTTKRGGKTTTTTERITSPAHPRLNGFSCGG